MKVKIICPHCEESDLEDHGKEARCMKCHTIVYLPTNYDDLREAIAMFKKEHEDDCKLDVGYEKDVAYQFIVKCQCGHQKALTYLSN